MQCPACQQACPPGAKFCPDCGARLAESCSLCGTPLPAEARFCTECGTPAGREAAGAPARASSEPVSGGLPPAPVAGEGERRHLTVMFCDLVGSTALADRLDPEVVREVLREYQEACAPVIARYDGHLAQVLGDGLLVYFGYPQAHEDDAQRAAHAGLGIVEALARLNLRLGSQRGVQLSVRIGIHSGPTVVGPRGGEESDERQVFGQTIHLAARVEADAEPNSVVVTAETLELLRGHFVTRDLGSRSFKGIEHPVVVHQLVRPTDPRYDADAGAASGRTTLIGRDKEIALIHDRWDEVSEGRGQVVLLAGDAGIGKSRLVGALRERLTEEPHAWLEGHSSPYHQNSAFYALLEILEQGFRFGREDPAGQRIAKLERALEAMDAPLPGWMPLFTSLLGLSLPDRYTILELSPEAQRRKTLEVLLGWFFGLAEREPAVIVVEDLHWIDPSSLELIDLLVEQVATVPILLVLTFRPSFEPAWGTHSHVAPLTLHPLTRKQSAAMVSGVTGGRALPAEVLRQVIAKADGVPLFVEELTMAVLESDLLELAEQRYEVSTRHLEFAIPSTLQDSLMARLDRLGSAKEMAQLSSVLGREFSHELLEAVWEPSGVPEAAMDRLVSAGLLHRRGVPPASTYTFKHALIQETAYQSLLKSRRQGFHARVARVLEERFPERLASEPEVVARHHEEAGQVAQAVVHYGRAGDRATRRSAYAEAIVHLGRALDLLRGLPESPERAQQELTLRVALGPALIAFRGYGDPEVERNYERASALCESLEEVPELFEALWGLANYYQAQAALGTALGLSEQLVSIAEQAGDPQHRVWAHVQIGAILFWRGEYARSLRHLERSMALYRPDADWFLPGAPDPGVVSQVYGALALWRLGHPDRALAMSREGVAMARKIAHPFSLAVALCFAGVLHQWRREHRAVLEHGEEAVSLSREQCFPQWHAMGRLLLGWARASLDGEPGVQLVQEGLNELAGIGTRVGAPGALAMLAEADRAVGRLGEALGAVQAAQEIAKQTDQPAYDSDLQRLEGEIRLEQRGGAEAEAESCFRRALETARRTQAKADELRAATGLCRLLHGRGRTEEARALLADTYGWFTEGFETADLEDAKALLRELA